MGKCDGERAQREYEDEWLQEVRWQTRRFSEFFALTENFSSISAIAHVRIKYFRNILKLLEKRSPRNPKRKRKNK